MDEFDLDHRIIPLFEKDGNENEFETPNCIPKVGPKKTLRSPAHQNLREPYCQVPNLAVVGNSQTVQLPEPYQAADQKSC